MILLERYDSIEMSEEGFGNGGKAARSAKTTNAGRSSQITVISFLNVVHQSMQQKYDFHSETSHYVFVQSHRSDSRNPRGRS
jgi:hypothetical protein